MLRIIPISLIFIFLISGSLLSCMTAADHQRELASTKEREMTVGIVQKEIRVGMSQPDVALALGSPNIVTSDGFGKETWIYDKIATEASYSASSGGVSGGVGGGGMPSSSLILGGVGAGYTKAAGAYGSTQKTLTVVIKFDNNKRVESFSYHASKF